MPRRLARADARALAHEVLVRVEATAAFADALLAARLAATRLGAPDRALATRLVYGTLAWQGRLDHHLAALVHGPLEELDAPVRAALRLGLYQLLFLTRVPAHAAVDTSVRLLRAQGTGAAGLVNAVLRRAARGEPAPPLPAAGVDPLGRLAVEWSHPRWLVERWAADFGLDAVPALLAAHNARGRTALRANRLRTTRAALLDALGAAGVEATPSPWSDQAVVVARGAGRLRALGAWREGLFAYQGEASQLIAPLLAPVPGARLLDACAAPGGKATHLAALLGGTGLVVALDARPSGVRRVVAEARRLAATTVRAAGGDAIRPPFARPFAGVLVDAPCSGLGTLARHPELRWRRRPEDIPRLADLQTAMLAGVAPLVAPGALLVYAVCTLTREETEGVVERFLAAHPRFRREPVGGEAPAALATPAGALLTLPHRHGLDGFFAARFRAARDLDSRRRVG